MNWRRIAAAAGTAAVGLATVAVYTPALLPIPASRVDRLFAAADPLALVTVIGLLVGGYAMITALWVRLGQDRAPPLVEKPPERPEVGTTEVTGATIDEAFERGDPLGIVRDELQVAAVEAWMHATGTSADRAEAAVASGEWTDDPRAAAYLAECPDTLPLGIRLRDWLATEPRARRQTRHALEAVERTWRRETVPEGADD